MISGYETAHGRPEGVEAVQVPSAGRSLGRRVEGRSGNHRREGRAHEGRGQQQRCRGHDDTNHRQPNPMIHARRQRGKEVGEKVEQFRGEHDVRADGSFQKKVGHQRGTAGTEDLSAGIAPETQATHKNDDDHGRRADGVADDGDEHAIPRDLRDEATRPRGEKGGVDQDREQEGAAGKDHRAIF